MTLMPKLTFVAAALAGITACAFAQYAPNRCSNRAISGLYTFTCTGTVALSPSVSIPVALIGSASSDGRGHWEGPTTADFNGQFMLEYLSTTGPNAEPSVVNSDCTGTVTYEMYSANPDTASAQDLGTLPIRFVIMDDGNQIRGLPTAPGYTVTCQLLRVHSID